MTQLLVHPVLLLTLLLGTPAVAGDLHDWKVKEHTGYVIASAPGKITPGEKQRFVFFKKDCTTVQHIFSVYTRQSNDFTKLKGKVIVVEFNGDKIGGEVRLVEKAMLGHVLMISFGSYNKDILLPHLQKKINISSKLVDGNNIIASEFFDVLENEWSTEGIEEAFAKSYETCMQSASIETPASADDFQKGMDAYDNESHV